MTRAGRFISFEGVEGVGKTTAMSMAAERLAHHKIEFIQTREPGGTQVAEQLRDIVLGDHQEQLTDITELMLMFAARAQSVALVIAPALARGDWVLCDRFTDATMAYQGAGRGMSVQSIRTLAQLVHGDLWPDKTVLLQAPPSVTAERLGGRGKVRDRIEAEASVFFERVAQGYQQLADAEPNRFALVDAAQSLAQVRAQINTIIDQVISDNSHE